MKRSMGLAPIVLLLIGSVWSTTAEAVDVAPTVVPVTDGTDILAGDFRVSEDRHYLLLATKSADGSRAHLYLREYTDIVTATHTSPSMSKLYDVEIPPESMEIDTSGPVNIATLRATVEGFGIVELAISSGSKGGAIPGLTNAASVVGSWYFISEPYSPHAACYVSWSASFAGSPAIGGFCPSYATSVVAGYWASNGLGLSGL